MAIRIEKLSRALMRRSMRLLEMEYKPSEMANELNASTEQILKLVSAGAPARKDSNGRYWIHGLNFAKWLSDVAPKKDKDKSIFADNECYCLQCRAIVIYDEYRRKDRIIFGTCPQGHKVSRFTSKAQKEKGKAKRK